MRTGFPDCRINMYPIKTDGVGYLITKHRSHHFIQGNASKQIRHGESSQYIIYLFMLETASGHGGLQFVQRASGHEVSEKADADDSALFNVKPDAQRAACVMRAQCHPKRWRLSVCPIPGSVFFICKRADAL